MNKTHKINYNYPKLLIQSCVILIVTGIISITRLSKFDINILKNNL
jgi:hypothetical protein